MATVNEELKAHAELHKTILDCGRCCPCLKGEVYCEDCKKAVTDFMDKYGAGALTKDEFVENLRLQIRGLEKDSKILQSRLDEKIERVEELKLKLKQR